MTYQTEIHTRTGDTRSKRVAGLRAAKLLCAAAALVLPLQGLQAATQYWDINGNGTWNTTVGTNDWSASSTGGGDTNFVTGNDAIFSSSAVHPAGTITITTTALAANSLTVNGPNAYTFTSGGTLTLGNVTAGNSVITLGTGAGAVTFQGAITLAQPASAQTYTIANSSTNLLTFGGTFTESLSGAGAAGTTTILFNGGGGVTFNGAINGNLATNPGGSIVLSATGSGPLTLNAANNAEGTAALSGSATLNVGNSQALQDFNLQMLAGSTVNFTNGTTAATIAGLGGPGGTLTLTNTGGAAVALTLEGASLGSGAAPTNINPTSATNISGLGSVTLLGVTNSGNNPNAGTQTLTGVLSFTGTGGLNVANTGSTGPGATSGNNTMTLVLQGSNTYTGPTTVNNGGTLTVNANGSIASSAGYTIQKGATLNLAPAAANTANLLNTSGTVTLTAGAINYTSANTTSNLTQTFAALNLGSGNSTITITPGAGKLAALAASSGTNAFVRSGAGTALIRGTNLNQSNATNAAMFTLGDGGASLGLVGSASLNGGATNDATLALMIASYLFGDTTAAGTGSNFVTYDATLGLRVLNATEDVVLSAGYNTQTSPDNAVGFSGVVTSATGIAVNSLLFNVATQTLDGSGGPLVVNSGAVAAVANNETIGSGWSSLTLGNNEGVITVTTGNTLTIATPISISGGSADLVKTGAGVLVLTASNAFSGPTYVNQGTLQVGSATATGDLGGSAAVLLGRGVALTFNRTNGYNYTGGISGTNFSINTLGNVNSATVTQSGLGAVTLGSVSNVATITRSANTGALTLGPVTGVSTITDSYTTGSSAPTTVNQTGTGNTIGTLAANANGSVIDFNGGAGATTTISTVNAVNGGNIVFGGSSTSTTTINNQLNSLSSGGLLTFTSGTVVALNGRLYGGNLLVNGGVFQIGTAATAGGRLSMATDGQTLTVSSGTLNLLNTQFGLRMGTDGPAGVANGPSTSFTGTQTGGTVLVGSLATGGANGTVGAVTNVDISGTSTGKTDSYSLSGGIFSAGTIGLGAAAAASGTTTFTLSGSGVLIVSGNLQGGAANDITAVQVFAFNGGTLSANTINTTYLRSSVAAVDGTFVNAGGILSPGTTGTAGLTTLTGNYAVSSTAAALAIDIGGANAATAFQNTPASASFDKLAVTGAASLGGQLTANLINSFVPTTSSTFTVLTATTVTGTFTNLFGKVPVTGSTDPFSPAFTIKYNPANVVLFGYVENEWQGGGNWGTGGAPLWTNGTDPNAARVGAKFNTAGVANNNVTLDQARTVGQLLFGGTNYTIATSNTSALTFDNGGAAATALVTANSGSQAINTPVMLNSNLSITGSAGASVAFGGNISGAAENISITGVNAVLSGSNSHNNTTLNSGVLLTVGNSNALGSGSATFAGASTLRASAPVSIPNAIFIAPGVTGTLDAQGNAITLGGVVSGNAVNIQGAGGGRITLTNSATYTGATTVNSGALLLGNNGNLGNTAVTVNSGAAIGANENASSTSNTITGPLTMNAGSAFTMVDGFFSTFNISGNANLYAGAPGVAPTYTFDISGSNGVSDMLNIGGLATLSNSGARINVVPVGGGFSPGNSYTIITGSAGSGLTGLTLGSSRGAVGNIAYIFNLTDTSTSATVTITQTGLAVAYWTGNQGSVWNTINSGSSNWSSSSTGSPDAGAAPSFLTDVFFSASGASNLTNTLGASSTINSLTFTSGNGVTTIGANDGTTLNLVAGSTGNPGITDLSASPQTINENVALGGIQTWSGTTGAVLNVGGNIDTAGSTLTISGPVATTISGTISGAGGLILVGPGVTVLSNTSNSYSGGLTVAGGILRVDTVNNAGVNGELGNNTSMTLGSSAVAGTLEYTGAAAGSTTLPISLAASGTGAFQVDTAGTALTLAGVISGNGALLKTGSGNLILTASNSYGGGTTIASGTLQLGDGAANNGYVNGNIANNAALVYADPVGATVASAETVSGAISGGGVVIKTGSGTVIFTSVSNYSGVTTVNQGVLGEAVAASGTVAPFGTNTVTVNTNGQVALGLQSAADATSHTVLNNFSINGGSLLAFEGVEHLAGAVGVTGNGGYLSSAYSGKPLNLDGVVSGTGALAVDAPQMTSLGDGGVAFNNAGNTYSGTLTINGTSAATSWAAALGLPNAGSGYDGGRIFVGQNTALQNATILNNSTRADGGITGGIVFQTAAPSLGALGGSGNTFLQVGGTAGGAAVALTAGGNNASTTYSGVLSGIGSLIKTGTGTMALANANTLTGAVTINRGILSADAAGALATTTPGAIAVNAGGTLRTVATGGVVLGGGAIALNNNGILQAGDGGAASVNAAFSGVLTYSGNTYINLADNGSSAALGLNGAGTGLVRGTNVSTLIVNGLTALDGATDTITVANIVSGNQSNAGQITNGILPVYEVGTVGAGSNADFLTTVAAGATIAGSPIKAYSGYTSVASGAFAPAVAGVYDIQANASMSANGSAFAIKIDNGVVLAGAAGTTLTLGGGGASQGGLILNGGAIGAPTTFGIPTLNTTAGELAVYTGGVGAITSNINSSSGGPFLTFFGPGTLTLTGSSITDSNAAGTIAINGNVIANIGSPFSNNPVTVNNGTFSLGLAGIFNGAFGSAMTVNNGGTLNLQGNSETVSNLNGGSATLAGGTITSSSAGGVLVLNNSNGNFYGGITSANLGVTKYGNNTQNLQGLINYGGTTTVNGGQLTFAPAVAGANDGVGVLAFGQGYGAVQSTYAGSGTTNLTFANVLARPAGAMGNFVTSGGANGTTNAIILSQYNGATAPTAALLDRGLFYNGGSYAAYDSAGFVRAYGAGDANYVLYNSGSTIVGGTASNVFMGNNAATETSVAINTLQIGGNTITFTNNSQVLQTNGILSAGGTPVIGSVAVPGSLGTTASGAELVIRQNAGTLVINASLIDNGGTALTVSGNVTLAGSNGFTGVATVDAGTLTVGNGATAGDLGASPGVVLNSGGNLSFNHTSAYSYTNPITTGFLASGSTITQSGSGTLTLGTVTNSGNSNTLAITRNAGTGAFNLGVITGIGALTDNSVNGLASPTTVNESGTGLTIASIAGAVGSVVNLTSSNGTGVTTIVGSLTSPGQTVVFNGGTWNLIGSGNNTTSVVVNSGTVQTSIGSGQNYSQIVAFTINGGLFNDQAQYGFRAGSTFGAASASSGAFTGTQTGGLFIVANDGLQIGSNSGTSTASFALSGGTLSTTAPITLGAAVSGSSQTTFALSGGKLITNSTISGAQGSGALQAFVWTGGELAANAFNATNLTSSTGVAVSAATNTLTNAGSGILAPGDLAIAGKTSITGNYSVASASASMAIDILGINQANSFQNGGINGYYDLVAVSGTASLGGALNVNLTGTGGVAFAPASATNFTILTGGAVSGSFTNTTVASVNAPNNTVPRVIANDGLTSFAVNINATNVVLNSATLNQWVGSSGSNWGTGGANVWSAQDVNGKAYAAEFANAPAAGPVSVALDQSRTVQGLVFNSTTRQYTISSSNGAILTLDNTGNSAPAYITDSSAGAGNHTVSAPLVLNSNLTVNIANPVNTLTLSGGISDGGAGKSLSLTGSGTLVLSGNNTYGGPTSVDGTLLVTGSLSGNAAVSVINGTLGGSGSIAGITTVGVAGILAPAATLSNTAGITLTIGNTVNLNAGSTLAINLDETNGFADLLSVGGNLNLAGADTLTVSLVNGVNQPASGTTYTIASYGGTLAGTFGTVNLPANWILNYGTGVNSTISITAIPEPGTWAMLLGGAGMLLAFRRRSRWQK